MSEGKKYDGDKLQLNLIPPEVIEELGKVLTYGAAKYEANNWKKVEAERYVAALLRHYTAWRKGEDKDAESGIRHLTHMLANISFLLVKEMENTEVPTPLSSSVCFVCGGTGLPPDGFCANCLSILSGFKGETK